MRILWLGDSADTGFGVVSREIGKRLIERGHDVRFINRNSLGWPGTGALAGRVWDAGYFNADQLAYVVARGFPVGNWKADHVVLLADHQFARDTVSANVDAWRETPVWHYVPIEGRDLSPLWAKLWDILRPVAITKFGADEITRLTGKPTPFVYHGVDREVFHPVSRETPILGIDEGRNVPLRIKSKADAKRHFGLDPDDIILLRTDRHVPRKNYNAMLRAIAPVLAERPNVRVVIHCKTIDFGGSLHDVKAKLPKSIQGQIGFTEGHDTWRGMGAKTLATLYNAADIYLSNCSEGFGLALAESIACDTPVLGLDYSAVPEVVGDAGELVPAREFDNIYSHYWGEPASDEAYAASLRLMLDHLEIDAYRGRGPVQALKFDWDNAADQFDALFAARVEVAA